MTYLMYMYYFCAYCDC